MATIHADTTGNWSDTTKWDLDRIPVADDDVIIDTGVVMTVDVARIPATSGTLTSLAGAGTGNVVIGTIGHPPGFALYATTIQAATASFINVTSNGSDHVVSIVATDIFGGGANGKCIYCSGTGGTVNITGNMTGGSGTAAYGVMVDITSNINIFSSTIKGGSDQTASGLYISATTPAVTLSSSTGTGCNIDNTGVCVAINRKAPVWNPLASNWTKWGTTYHSVAPDKAKVLDDTSVVISTSGASEAGTYHAPEVGEVLDTAAVGTTTGTYHEATVAEVQDGVMFGAGSALEGTYAGGGGGGGRPEIRGGNL